MSLPACPQCHENYTYEDGHTFVCPMCFHEWTQESMEAAQAAASVRDVHGNPLADGDDVTIVKDLKMGSETLKQGTRVRNIKILDQEVDGHDLQARVDGHGTVYLKGSVVKK